MIAEVNPKKITHIVVNGVPEIESEALLLLLRSQVTVILFANDNLLGQINPDSKTSSDILQFQLLMSEELKLHLMQVVTRRRLRDCRRFLQRSAPEKGAEEDFKDFTQFIGCLKGESTPPISNRIAA